MHHWPKQLMIAMLYVYKWAFSPAIAAMGVRCRHEPSCSSYAMEAVRRYGAWRGGWMALARFQRCRPGGSAGYDPVPELTHASARFAAWRTADWRGPKRAANGEALDPDDHA